MKIQNVKGGYDYLPAEQKVRNYINNILKEVFEQYGFKSIETSISLLKSIFPATELWHFKW